MKEENGGGIIHTAREKKRERALTSAGGGKAKNTGRPTSKWMVNVYLKGRRILLRCNTRNISSGYFTIWRNKTTRLRLNVWLLLLCFCFVFHFILVPQVKHLKSCFISLLVLAKDCVRWKAPTSVSLKHFRMDQWKQVQGGVEQVTKWPTWVPHWLIICKSIPVDKLPGFFCVCNWIWIANLGIGFSYLNTFFIIFFLDKLNISLHVDQSIPLIKTQLL